MPRNSAGEVTLDRALTDILRECQAPVQLTAFLVKEELDTPALLYDAVKSVDDVEAKICAQLDPPATSLRAISTVRAAWRRAEVDTKKSLTGEGLVPEDWELPLPQPTKDGITSKHSQC